MSEPFLAEVKMVPFNFAPRGWAFCDGQILPINQNQSLFSLLGTTFGGDGRTSFALPDLRGRTPVHPGDLGVPQVAHKAGTETHTLNASEVPSHSHGHTAHATDGTTGGTLQSASTNAAGALLTKLPSSGRTVLVPYGPGTNLTALTAASITNVGGQSHNNMQPYLAINFIIALRGLFPSRN